MYFAVTYKHSVTLGTSKYYANILIFVCGTLGSKGNFVEGETWNCQKNIFSHYAVGHPNIHTSWRLPLFFIVIWFHAIVQSLVVSGLQR